MRTTVTLDDALLVNATRLSGLREHSALLREALTALIQRESARRLARLGGTERALKIPSRRRSWESTLNQSFGANRRFVFFNRALVPKNACFDMSAE